MSSSRIESDGKNLPDWTPELRQRVDELAAAVIDSRITPAEQQELARLLETYEQARDAYLEQLDVESMLRAREYRVGQASFGQSPSSEQQSASDTLSDQPVIHRLPAIWKISAAAVLLIAAGLFLGSRGETPEILATLTEADQPRWSDEGQKPVVGQKVGLGRLALVGGTARLTTSSEVELTLTAPCTIEFLSPRSVKVHSGRLKARVNGESAIGFRVTTPTADVVDLGTEFGVFVEQDGSSEVHVFQGVVVARAVGTDQVIPIYRNEAGRVAAEQRVSQDTELMNVYRPVSLVAVAARPDLFGQSAPLVTAQRAPTTTPIPRNARVVFIGDPYIDSDAPLQLLEQAWADAGWAPAPRLINGFVPDWIHQHIQRIEHHVLRFRPTHAVVSFGPQYAWQVADRITPEKFGSDLTKLVDLLASRGIEPILATAYRFRPEDADAQHVLDQYNEQVRRLAEQKGLRLADIDARFRDAGEEVNTLVDSGGHLGGFEGYQFVTAALLDALGQRNLPVPNRLDLRMLPGVPAKWQYHLLPKDRPQLTGPAANELQPAADWLKLELPQEDRFTPRLAEPSHSPLCRERACGYGTHLTTGTHPIWQGVSTVESATARSVWLHVGGGTHQVWLNGEKVFDENSTFPAGHGYHAGYETVAVKLKAGENRLVVECSGSMFLSMTDTQDPPRRELER